MEQTSHSECTDAPNRAADGKCRTCSRCCLASATTPTWFPKTAASPAPSPVAVSSLVSFFSKGGAKLSCLVIPLLCHCYFRSPADVLCFDNSYSILQSKRVSYKVEVLPPVEGPLQSPLSRGEQRLQ